MYAERQLDKNNNVHEYLLKERERERGRGRQRERDGDRWRDREREREREREKLIFRQHNNLKLVNTNPETPKP